MSQNNANMLISIIDSGIVGIFNYSKKVNKKVFELRKVWNIGMP